MLMIKMCKTCVGVAPGTPDLDFPFLIYIHSHLLVKYNSDHALLGNKHQPAGHLPVMPAVTCLMRALPLSICTAAKCVASAHCHFANISSVRPAQEQPTSLASYIQNQLLYMQGEGRHSSKVQHWQCLPGTRTGHRCPSSAALNVRGPAEKTGQLTPQRNGTSGHGSGAKAHSLMLRHGKGKALRRSWRVHMKRETKRGQAAQAAKQRVHAEGRREVKLPSCHGHAMLCVPWDQELSKSGMCGAAAGLRSGLRRQCLMPHAAAPSYATGATAPKTGVNALAAAVPKELPSWCVAYR